MTSILRLFKKKNPMKEHDDRLLFLPTLTAQAVEQEVVLSQIKSQYKFDNSPEWLPEVVASYLVKDIIGSEKNKGNRGNIKGIHDYGSGGSLAGSDE